MMHHYRFDTLPVSKWRNGGGETREIISWPPDASEFGWRASIATIASSGDFSLFPGVDRVITLLQGDKVALHSEGHLLQTLTPDQPFAFRGELPIHATLHGATSHDFNIMTRRDQFDSAVIVTDSAQQSEMGVCWVIRGEWQCGAQRLQAGEGAWWTEDGTPLTPCSAQALLLFAAISRVP
ncbi:HutD/Ves family protein [Erwinia sp. V71]|uniref:HutD/Ves family protein n=1 Tax=Erwinia sp. V71 TaxID=3369424 RepID=UPI003F5DBC4B